MRETLLLPICVLLLLCLCCGGIGRLLRTLVIATPLCRKTCNCKFQASIVLAEHHRQQDISAAINSGRLQAPSRLDPWGPANYGPDYFAFSNVQLSGGELVFHTDSGKSAGGGAEPPSAIPLNLHESVLPLPVTQVVYHSRSWQASLSGELHAFLSSPTVTAAAVNRCHTGASRLGHARAS